MPYLAITCPKSNNKIDLLISQLIDWILFAWGSIWIISRKSHCNTRLTDNSIVNKKLLLSILFSINLMIVFYWEGADSLIGIISKSQGEYAS